MATNSAGVRITQVGVNAQYAADYQYVFNSDWPSLAIAFDVTIPVVANGIGQAKHALKFFPLTMAWYSVNGVSMGRFYGVTTFDKQNVYIDNTANSSDITVNIKCYNVDIGTSVDYTLPAAPIFKTPYDPTTGIKVSKFGKSIASKDLRDFILHSRAQSPAVLSILTQDKASVISGKNTISYKNPAKYTPWVLGFISPLGNNTVYQCFPPGGNQSAPAFFQIGNVATVWTNGTGGNGTLVVLRDPLVLPNTVQVVY